MTTTTHKYTEGTTVTAIDKTLPFFGLTLTIAKLSPSARRYKLSNGEYVEEGQIRPKRTHQKHWADNTATARTQARTQADNAWAQAVSVGKYPTLRTLMRAIHRGDIVLVEQSSS